MVYVCICGSMDWIWTGELSGVYIALAYCQLGLAQIGKKFRQIIVGV